LEDAVAAENGIVHDETQSGSVFENDGTSNKSLDADAVASEGSEAAPLLLGLAEDADKNYGGVEIARDIDVIDGDEADIGDFEFAADDFADFAFEEFADALNSQRGHGDKALKAFGRRGLESS
jgi:hypothetical protein